MIQGTEEWLLERCGKVTASRIADVVAKTRSGWGASRANYMAQLIVERLTGKPVETYQNQAMVWGIETEPQARAWYEFTTNMKVEEVGFIRHPSIDMSGASPDGLVCDHGLLEIKCPNSATHIDFLLTGVIPDKYIKQMQWQMACTGREWCDFVSYDPRMPTELQAKVVRVFRNSDMIGCLEKDVIEFLTEVDQKVDKLANMMTVVC